MKFQVSCSLSVLVGVASSHTIFTQLTAGGVTNGEKSEILTCIGVGIRIPSYDGPITNVNSNDIACNGGPNPTTPSSKIIDVQAGSTVKARWRHTQQSGSNDIIDAGHSGPVMAYLKKVSNAATDPGYGGGWFKISEAGLINAACANLMIISKAMGRKRSELIALHGAGSSGGAQFYMECAQINITGGTGAKSPATVSLPGAYKANDPGILVNIYSTPAISKYTIPAYLGGRKMLEVEDVFG
ncbi:putative endo-beta-1,4-glucanase D [Glarea lozoyensis 74030]|uniref:AA9 family lytic polysaccharide monooxygenase n=1 Tax=Glarea lozoyensis (strain ATCC 74030 / MF5533) TaxID=1104152 RepID=H0EMB0_GLAL7|nr:putative endo-beta-1,4-glucanase D [Glarea lozoyensis 74030]